MSTSDWTTSANQQLQTPTQQLQLILYKNVRRTYKLYTHIKYKQTYNCSVTIFSEFWDDQLKVMAANSGRGATSETLCESAKEDSVEEETTLKLKLQSKKKPKKKIQWTEDTVDNEGTTFS